MYFRAPLKTPNMDSRVLRPFKGLSGNDMKVAYYALHAKHCSFVIPANAGIHELLEEPFS